MDLPNLVARLESAIEGATFETPPAVDQPTLLVAADRLDSVARLLRDDPNLKFALLADVSGVDFWPKTPRFEVVYHLASIVHQRRLRLKVRLGEGDTVPTVQTVWPAANWLEREVWDLMGVVFDGHGDLRRLLMPEDWEGHPLRKDYPVQIRMAAESSSPLQVSEEEFRASLEADRQARRGERSARER
jgi:NADH-quinone oxidoreductase subunit C